MALGHVITGSSHIITVWVGAGAGGSTMEGMVGLANGKLPTMPVVLEHKIGGISAMMLPPIVSTHFHCLVKVTGVNQFCSVFDEIS